MKKIILIIVLLLPLTVKAETFYSSYYLKESSTQAFYEESDTLKREKKEVYHNYNYIRVNEDYYLKNYNPISSPFLDDDDEIISTKSCMSMVNNSEGPFTKFWVRKLKNVKYIMFRSFQAPKAVFDDIKIFVKDKEISYKIIKTNYKLGDLIPASTEFLLELDNSYNIYDLKIETDFTDVSLSRIAYMLKIYSEYIPDITKFEFFSNEVVRGKAKEKYIVTFVNENDFQDFIKTQTPWIHAKDYNSTYEVNYYTYPIQKYKYYNLIKNYINEYSETPVTNYFLDYSDKKIIYSYFERYIVDILDEINNKDQINNIISYSSYPLEKTDITSNIDINKNGEYYIKIKLKDDTIYKKIIVKIHEENKDETKELIKTKINNVVVNKNNINATIITKHLKTIKTTTMITTTKKVSTTKAKNKILVNKQNHFIKSNHLLMPILLLLFIILIIIRKKKI